MMPQVANTTPLPPPVAALVRRTLALWAPPRQISAAAWADDNRYLSPESSAQAGKWTCFAYQREPLDAFSDPSIYRVVVKSATQMLKTETILNAIGYVIDVDPGPALMLCHRKEDAQELVEERIDPMLRDTPVLRHKVWGRRRLKKNFRGGMLVIKSGGSPSNVASRSLRYLFFDEVDKYVRNVGDEGNVVSLGRKRLANYKHKAKEVIVCSPTYENSQIDRDYAKSDQREFFVRCPHCGAEQSMMRKFRAQVRWDTSLPTPEAQAQSARYHCENPGCEQPWTEQERQTAVDAGRYVAQAPFNGVAGFWISELYSRSRELWQIVLDHLQKKDSPEDERTFYNTSLAENWAEQGDTPDWEKLANRREDYMVASAPAGALVAVAAADVHPDRIEVEVVGFGRNRETWSIRYEIFEGRTSDPDSIVWKQLEALMGEVYPHPLGRDLPVSLLFIDSGFQSNDVYNWVRQQPPSRVVAIKGVETSKLPVTEPSPVEVTMRGKKIKHGLRIRTVWGPFFKEQLYSNLKKSEPTDEQLAEAKGNYPAGYCHFPKGPNYGDEHYRQICAEQLVTIRDKRGRQRREWQQIRARNEALDCRVYAMAAAWQLGVNRWKEDQWKAREESLRANLFNGPVVSAPAPEAPRVAPVPVPATPVSEFFGAGGRNFF